jgi:protein TonB
MPEAPVTMPEMSAPPPAPPQPEVKRKAEPSILPTLFHEGYGTYQTKPSSFVYSYALVTALMVAVILLASIVPVVPKTDLGPVVDLVLPPVLQPGHDAGGGAHDPKPASKGVLPKSSPKVPLTPPMVVPPPDAALQVAPTVKGPETPPVLAQLGDPLGRIGGPPSNGPGGGGGIGSGYGGGVGNGTGAYRPGNGVTAPVALSSPDPEYSEEARKAKYQGVVVLTLVVGADGRARDMRVARSLGLGLDEKAMEAVKTWTFKPGEKDGKPVATLINVEVEFHLY